MSLEMKYFVLKPKGCSPYSSASRQALLAYANTIQEEDEQLANELKEWATEERGLALEELGL